MHKEDMLRPKSGCRPLARHGRSHNTTRLSNGRLKRAMKKEMYNKKMNPDETKEKCNQK